MQILFCLETNQKADTDWVYIRETIQQFYTDKNVRLRPIYMGTKMNLLQKKTQKEIGNCVKAYAGETAVVVCTDTDHYDTNPSQRDDNERIEALCAERNYRHIWFCRDIEEVYIGECVAKKDKVARAAAFRRNHGIAGRSKASLSQTSYSYGTSNILNVLDNLLARK